MIYIIALSTMNILISFQLFLSENRLGTCGYFTCFHLLYVNRTDMNKQKHKCWGQPDVNWRQHKYKNTAVKPYLVYVKLINIPPSGFLLSPLLSKGWFTHVLAFLGSHFNYYFIFKLKLFKNVLINKYLF